MAGEEWVFALAFLAGVAGVCAANRFARGRAWSIERRRLITMLCLFFAMFVVMDSWLFFYSGSVSIPKILFLLLLLVVQLGWIWFMTFVLNRIFSAISHLRRTD
ncbi:MAG TPA: hypothetical protein VFX19_03885 [Dehalococcoidia bacterium]|nr:hypothetical protein [Dehalococcoidia bacterium]